MRPFLHAHLVNGRTGDPAVYVETLYEKQTILFDLGDISNLPPRKILRLEHVFVSHTHIDHFIGFDRLLRLLAGREQKLHLYGPPDFIAQVQHKLQAYRWDLVDRYVNDLALSVTEVLPSLDTRKALFCLKNAFALEPQPASPAAGGTICAEPRFRVSTAVLNHHGTPCLAFAAEESAHVNVWKNRLLELGLNVGPWLQDLKRAIVEKRPDDYPIPGPLPGSHEMPLGALRGAVTVTPGQKIAYVTDAADTAANRAGIIKLVQNADLLFIEATFSEADAAVAAGRAHLTAAAAGTIARQAGVRRIEPFHFSPRYAGEEARLLNEAMAAFAGTPASGIAANP